VTNTGPTQFPAIRFSVVNPQTGAAYNLRTDPAWTSTANGASRLFLQVAWTTRDYTNVNSDVNSLPGGRGAASPIPVNALGTTTIDNGDGTYTATSPKPIPATVSGSGTVAMEGHPAGQDATGAWTVRVPVRSVYKHFAITGTAVVARRQIVDMKKCMGCHESDGTGVAPQLVAHGNNRTEEPLVCAVCHNPNNTDIPFRNINPKLVNGVAVTQNPVVRIGTYTYPEQSLDFKRLIHGIHASAAKKRKDPLVVVGREGTLFAAATLTRYPTKLKRCTACHIDDGRKGTHEIPLAAGVLGSTMNTRSTTTTATGTFNIDVDPANDVKITPIAATCSSCHDGRETISHMVSKGGASFNTTESAIALGSVKERCVDCHGAGRDKAVRKVHD
jgi:OmcA/MtrC family decaheme c-type cytochrome